MSSQGPNNPTAAVNDSSLGTRGWLGLPDHVFAADGKNACPSSSITDGTKMMGLDATGYGFSVPDDAVNITVTFAVLRHAVGTVHAIDAAARLILAGVVQADDHSLPDAWPQTPAYASYAFTGLTPAQVNDPGFGFALSAAKDRQGQYLTATPFVDVITATASW